MESSEKGKRNKTPWVPKSDRRRCKKKGKEKFRRERTDTLAESDKGLWFHQQPSDEESTTATVPSTSSSRKKLKKDAVDEDLEELDEELDSDVVDTSGSSSDGAMNRIDIDSDRCVVFHKRNLQEGLDETVSCRKFKNGSEDELKQL